MKRSGLVAGLLFLVATALNAQQAHPPKPGPYLQSFQSLTAPKLSASRTAAVASDRDLSSEKIAIAVVVVILAVVIIRSVK